MGQGRTVIGSTGTLIVGANDIRKSIIISNIGSADVFLGSGASVSVNTGILLASSGGSLAEDSGGTRVYQGSWYAVSTSTGIVTYWEREGKQ